MNDPIRIMHVALKQQHDALLESQKADLLASRIDKETNTVERMIERHGRVEPKTEMSLVPPLCLDQPALVPWSQLVEEAVAALPNEVSFSDLLSTSEIEKSLQRLSGWESDFSALHRLRPRDYAIAGAAGVLAGLVDVLLVKVPRQAGIFGRPPTEGGWLSNTMKDEFSHLLPPETVKSLEKAFKVPHDFSTNKGLAEPVRGLGPRSHRLQSLGHDPLLGWIFGVRDILAGGFTAIGSDGKWSFQTVAGPEFAGTADLASHVVEAFIKVGGHMLSDVSTAAGLPPPMFGLLQLLQSGNIKGRSIARLSRLIYAKGYDFRHFLAGSIGTFLIDVIVRFSWMAGELAEGRELREALPIGQKPRLQTSLLLAHSVATAVNAGKVAITQNPLSVSWAQWLAFFRYLAPQIHWCLGGKERAREAFMTKHIDADFLDLQLRLDESWRTCFIHSVAKI